MRVEERVNGEYTEIHKVKVVALSLSLSLSLSSNDLN
jgi:hypothetical protein